MALKDAYGLVATGDIDENKTDFQNAVALGIDFNSATWSTDFIAKCIGEDADLFRALCVISFLRGAKLGAHGIMTKERANWLNGFATALHMVKFGKINLGETVHI